MIKNLINLFVKDKRQPHRVRMIIALIRFSTLWSITYTIIIFLENLKKKSVTLVYSKSLVSIYGNCRTFYKFIFSDFFIYSPMHPDDILNDKLKMISIETFE